MDTFSLKKHKRLSRCKGGNESKNMGQFVKKERDECDYVKFYGYCDQNSKKRIKGQEGSRQSERLKESKEVVKELICNCKSLNCPVCDDKYASKKTMLRHLKKQHKWTKKEMEKLKYQCPVCKISFWKKADMEAHIIIHNRKFDCSICGKDLKTKFALKTHVEYIHEGREKDKCHICMAEFQGKKTLKNHIEAVHEGKKSHLCSHCGYSSASTFQLRIHIEG